MGIMTEHLGGMTKDGNDGYGGLIPGDMSKKFNEVSARQAKPAPRAPKNNKGPGL